MAVLAPLLLSASPLGSSAADEFRQALPGYRFTFPRDHFSHDDYRTEWWYYTGHLRTGAGEEFGYQVTFFRRALAGAGANPSRWAARNLYLAHFGLSDIGRERFSYAERTSRGALGQAGASQETLRVWNGDWEVSGDGTVQRVTAKDGETAVNLTLTALKPPVIHGERGVSRKGAGRGHASHYYSITRLKTEGALTAGGKAVAVTGTSWMDHEFGSTELAADQVGWDWYSVQLDDDRELMLYVIRRRDGSWDPFSAGTWVEPDGTARPLKRDDFAIEALDRWQSPRGPRVYPMKWRIRVPELRIDLLVSPAFRDQELDTAKSTQVIYWEGTSRVEGSVGGRPVTGRGYVEMTGYGTPFRKKL